MDNVHNFDEYIKNNFQFLTRFLSPVQKIEEDKIWTEILEYANSYSDKKLMEGLNLICKDDVFDKNVSYRPRELYAQTWLKINGDKDLINELFSQVRDMVDSRGFCPEGRTNRCIQIVMLFEK